MCGLFTLLYPHGFETDVGGIFIAFILSNVLILTTTNRMMKLVNRPKQPDPTHESN